MYRDWAWEIFTAMEKAYKTETGWSGVKDVKKNPPEKGTRRGFHQIPMLAGTYTRLTLLFFNQR